MKIFLNILLLTNIVLAAFPTGNYYRIPVTSLSAGWAESATNWAFQYDLSSKLAADAVFKSNIDSAKNIAVYDESGTKRSRVVRLNLDSNKLFIAWDGAKSSSANKIFYIYASKSLNEVNAAATYTNSNFTNMWGVNNFADDATTPDAAGSSTGTVNGSITLGVTGKFGTGARWDSPSSSYIDFGNVTAVNSVNKFTMEWMMYLTSVSGVQTILIKNASATNNVYAQINAGYLVIGVSNSAAASGRLAISGNISTTTWYHCVIVYDGTQSDNANRLKLYINATAKTLDYQTTTIPASTGNMAAVSLLAGFTAVNTAPAANSILDEISIASDAKSANFITDRYTQFFSPNSVFSVGTGEVIRSKTTASKWQSYKLAYKTAFKPAYK